MSKHKILYQSKYFNVIEKEVEVNGNSFKKEFINRRPVVLMAALTPQNELYLASQYRHALGQQSLELVAGTLDDGEDPLTAAKRELQEEAGITAKTWKHLSTWHMSANMGAIIDFYLATGLQIGASNQDDEENIQTIKLPLTQAVEKVLSGEINIAPHAAAILLLDNLQKSGKI